MYSLIRAYGVKNTLNSFWGNQNISSLKLFQIFQQYRDIYVELENTFIVGPIYVHLKALEDDYGSSNLTLAQLFADNPSLSLPTVDEMPEFTQQSVRYMDAIRAGYSIELSAPGQPPGSNASMESKTELSIRRDMVSNKDLHDYCLVTVNGYLHQTDYDNKYLYVIDGGNSLKKSRRNTCGITSFERIGKLHKKQITFSDFLKVDADTPLYKRMYISIPDEYAGMQIMLSLGGYLIVPEQNVFSRISDQLWIVNTEYLDFVGRYMESRYYLDYSALGLTKFPKDPDKVSLVELQSDQIISRYLTMSQSFIIALESENINYVKHYVRHSPIANQYITYSNPMCPLFLGRGRQADYWKEQDENYWSIFVENGYRPHLIYDTADSGSLNFDSGAPTPYKIYENSRAFLMDMISDIRTN